jgi:DNA polymerase III subunit chi
LPIAYCLWPDTHTKLELMTEISFYHLRTSSLERALPALLAKAVSSGHRAVVLTSDDAQAKALDTHLWTYDPGSFLPHGRSGDEHESEQPILLTTRFTAVNQPSLLVVLNGENIAPDVPVSRVLDVFDGNDESALKAARERWKSYQQTGQTLTYFRQQENGGWVKEA